MSKTENDKYIELQKAIDQVNTILNPFNIEDFDIDFDIAKPSVMKSLSDSVHELAYKANELAYKLLSHEDDFLWYIEQMPESCFSCPHGERVEEGINCKIRGKTPNMEKLMYYKRRPKWCPLTTDPDSDVLGEIGYDIPF